MKASEITNLNNKEYIYSLDQVFLNKQEYIINSYF